ncbi:unnamed protein product, partial [Prunus brigantina]
MFVGSALNTTPCTSPVLAYGILALGASLTGCCRGPSGVVLWYSGTRGILNGMLPRTLRCGILVVCARV